jgi:NUDIX domain-containing protein
MQRRHSTCRDSRWSADADRPCPFDGRCRCCSDGRRNASCRRLFDTYDGNGRSRRSLTTGQSRLFVCGRLSTGCRKTLLTAGRPLVSQRWCCHVYAFESWSVRHCSCALFVREGRLLLGRRSQAERLYPGVWDLIGGHARLGTPEAALLREVQEETGSELFARVDAIAWSSLNVFEYGQ